ncbi:MAG: YciI family protein [Thalassovita sp.]
MLVALIAKDKAGALDIRKANRDDHLAYIKSTGVVAQAGPLLIDGDMAGSLIVLDVESMEAANAWAANDPYANAGLFQSVELIEWKKVVG